MSLAIAGPMSLAIASAGGPMRVAIGRGRGRRRRRAGSRAARASLDGIDERGDEVGLGVGGEIERDVGELDAEATHRDRG